MSERLRDKRGEHLTYESGAMGGRIYFYWWEQKVVVMSESRGRGQACTVRIFQPFGWCEARDQRGFY